MCSSDLKVRVNIVHPDAVFDTKLWTPEALQKSASRYGMTIEEYKTKNLMKVEIKSKDIGNMVSAALVGRDGSIDWLCLPRFDSPACFASLLGTDDHGRWFLGPVEEATATRSYREHSFVLDTVHETATGRVRVTDLMPFGDGRADLLRVVDPERCPLRPQLLADRRRPGVGLARTPRMHRGRLQGGGAQSPCGTHQLLGAGAVVRGLEPSPRRRPTRRRVPAPGRRALRLRVSDPRPPRRRRERPRRRRARRRGPPRWRRREPRPVPHAPPTPRG